MTTQKELLENHRKGLDKAYLQKYPNGKFVIQRIDYAGYDKWLLHWVPKRNTGAVHKRGISTELDKIRGISQNNYQACSFGKCNNYDSFEKLMAACQRQGISAELATAFCIRYNARQSEGFEIK